MESGVAARLVEINHHFYQTFARPFAATRRRLQPGVLRVLQGFPEKLSLLDLGCGNGELSLELLRRQHKGQYLGLDFSQALIETAPLSHNNRPDSFQIYFREADLTLPGWVEGLPIQHFERVTAFAVLHHIPGEQYRLTLLRQIGSLLMQPGGELILSNWQFLNSPRLKARIQPWEAAGLNQGVVDAGDYLLDWRSGGRGLRYVHQFSESELASLAIQTGFSVKESFYSDGKEGNLSLYQVWAL